MNAEQARKVSGARKLQLKDEKIANKRYDKILKEYIEELEMLIMLYASWGIWWAWIPAHYEPAIFLDAREHFEKLGFKYIGDHSVDMYIPGDQAIKWSKKAYPKWKDQWSISWSEFDLDE